MFAILSYVRRLKNARNARIVQLHVRITRLSTLQVTEKGRAALDAVQARREHLAVKAPGKKPSQAGTRHNAWDSLPNRCTDTICQASSDCDEDDSASSAYLILSTE